jgi:hypothetical protein
VNQQRDYQRGGNFDSRLARMEEKVANIETIQKQQGETLDSVEGFINRATAKQSILLMLLQPITAVITSVVTALIIAWIMSR